MRILGRLGEARFLGWEAFQKMAKCGIDEIDANNDKTSTVITHLEYLMKRRHRSLRRHEQCISISMTTLQQ